MSATGVSASGFRGPFWSLLNEFLTGFSAAAGIALINCVGNLGGFVGPYAIGAISTRFPATGTPTSNRSIHGDDGGLRSGCRRRLGASQSGDVHESYGAQAGEDDRLHDVNPEPRIRALSPNQFSVAVLWPYETEEDQ